MGVIVVATAKMRYFNVSLTEQVAYLPRAVHARDDIDWAAVLYSTSETKVVPPSHLSIIKSKKHRE